MFQASNFTPAKGLSNPHMQTMVAKWLTQKDLIPTVRETLELPDGDFVDLTWTETPEASDTKPIVVLLHGLQGCEYSHYVKSMFKAVVQKGWIGVLIHFRGCSGKPNRLAHSYHSGFTYDIRYFTEQLKSRYQHCKFAAIGYSLGGNVLTKYLAETPDSPYECATVICAPLHLSSCSAKINSGFSKIYQNYLLKLLKRETEKKIKLGIIKSITLSELKHIKTMWEFDNKVTAPLNGFDNAEHYYSESSGIKVLNQITKPCLIIHAQDDPFLSHKEITAINTLPDNVTFEVSTTGGHVGFLTGNSPFKPQYWLATKVPQFLQDFL
ncbi:hydrolase [Pseudocolwellia sp. HL-MZ7]|uniref:hydrolase n=1 Tax=Pseudocolwellia sp. HL-MZ7 TaxID=3400627 RepID=UPI003CFA98F3